MNPYLVFPDIGRVVAKMSVARVMFVLVERIPMFQIYVHHADQTTSTIHATLAQREDLLTLVKNWFDNGLITGWSISQ